MSGPSIDQVYAAGKYAYHNEGDEFLVLYPITGTVLCGYEAFHGQVPADGWLHLDVCDCDHCRKRSP